MKHQRFVMILIVTLLLSLLILPGLALAESSESSTVYSAEQFAAPSTTDNPIALYPYARTGKWIEIDLSRQRLIAHQGRRVVLSTRVSTGVPGKATPVGTFRVRLRIRRQTMSGPGYRLPNVQWVQYFVGNYAMHGTYWHHNFGRPMSHGCVNLTNRDARFLYGWASYGTPVVVHR